MGAINRKVGCAGTSNDATYKPLTIITCNIVFELEVGKRNLHYSSAREIKSIYRRCNNIDNVCLSTQVWCIGQDVKDVHFKSNNIKYIDVKWVHQPVPLFSSQMVIVRCLLKHRWHALLDIRSDIPRPHKLRVDYITRCQRYDTWQ